MNSQQQAAFKSWALGMYSLHKDELGEYLSVATYCAWKAWQAAIESPEVAELRKDAERLDWLDARAHCADWVEGEPTKRVIRAEDGQVYTGDTWREAIDAAMEKQK